MKTYKILPLELESDLPIISTWDEEFKDDPRYDNIRKFILEGNTYIGIGEVVETNYEKYPIGSEERKHAFVIKNNKSEIMGFVLALTYDLQSTEPTLIIQYIVLHPDFQNQGIGKKVLDELISNTNRYFNSTIGEVFATISKENNASRKVFESLGFTLEDSKLNFLMATKKINTLEKE